MADADDGSSSGVGGTDWELVSLTASAYAAAPGPVVPLLLPDARKKTEFPPAPAAIFMSQHFNLPAEALVTDLNGGYEEEESNPAMSADGEDLNTPCPERAGETELQDGGLSRSEFSGDGNGLQEVGGLLVISAVEELKTTVLCPPDAAGSDHIRSTSVAVAVAAATDDIVDSASLPAHVVPVAVPSGVAPNKSRSFKIPCEGHAWWNRTFRFLRNNSKESLTFRFIFVAATVVGLAILGQRDKLQLRLEFNVDSEKISCAAHDPLGQVKLNMIVGGRPVAQG